MNMRRFALIAVPYFWLLALFLVLARATPRISFLRIEDDPQAVGVYVFGYLVFFGLILHAALNSPL